MHYLLDIHYSSISHNILSNTIATVYFHISPFNPKTRPQKDFRNQKPVRAGWTGSSHPPRGREQATLAAGAPNGSLGRAPRGAKWAILRISQGQNRKRHRGARPVALVRGRQRPGAPSPPVCLGRGHVLGPRRFSFLSRRLVAPHADKLRFLVITPLQAYSLPGPLCCIVACWMTALDLVCGTGPAQRFCPCIAGSIYPVRASIMMGLREG